MCEMKFVKFLFLISIASVVLCRPINSDYYRKNYEVEERRPNAYYNRLPPNRLQIDETQNDDYDDGDDTQTDKPVYNNQYQSGSYPILVENKIKRKKRKRLCIPIQSVGSPLFSNRVKRNYQEKDDQGRTLGLLLGGGGYPYYGGQVFPGQYPSYAGNYPHQSPQLFPQQSPLAQRPQQSPVAQFGAPLYDAYGGYPCVPVSTGHIPNQGPFGFFGNGGLFDFGSGSSPSVNYPQTVIINRPPLFGNRPNYGNRPQSAASDSDGNRPGFFGVVMDKLQEFVTAINPEGVYSSLGDALQSLGNQIAMAPSNVLAPATEGVKTGYREFASLFY